MLLQAGQETLISQAFEQSFLIGFLVVIIVALTYFIVKLYNRNSDLSDAKEKIAVESLSLIKLVENQLNENKVSNEAVLKISNEVLTEMKLIKPKYRRY